MTKFVALALAVLTAGCMAERPMQMGDARTQTRLAEELQGRVQAGPPQSCVQQRNLRGNESAGEGAIIFRGTVGDLIYVNRPPGGCPEIGSGRAIKVRTTQTQICRGDIIEVFDPVTGFSFGGCGLGEFTPYRRQR